ncbi:Transthyretin-like family protein [Ancylostoma duodenale]|uniref:Transthyretin-like family protein n=1 Tax=Ancylostoma duodenale TaxID=51022 RepID=A0A0C2BWT1_9BILA|nr:Transthyretin-like family protein [Ancylostoma duodenale]
MGQFLLYGHTSEIMTIDPKLNIYHDCDDALTGLLDVFEFWFLFNFFFQPCQRKVTFNIPKAYVSSGEQPKTFFNIGQVNMQIQFVSEERDCLHRA